MKQTILIISTLCIWVNAIGQNSKLDLKIKLGTYNTNNDSHNNRFHFEEIILKEKNLFEYNARLSEFVKIKKIGKWHISKDTLILEEQNPEFPVLIQVKEMNDPTIDLGYVKISVLGTDGEQLKCQISTTLSDTTIVIENVLKDVLVPLNSADKFSVATGLYSYPTYYPKNKQSNCFVLKVASQPSFVHEKWLIESEMKIRPRFTNGVYASYFLKLVE